MCYCEYPAIAERTNILSAKKDHRCSECGIAIKVGSSYERYDSLFDGSWSHEKFCLSCQAAWQALWETDDCGCDVPIGDCWMALDDFGIATPYFRYDQYRQQFIQDAA